MTWDDAARQRTQVQRHLSPSEIDRLQHAYELGSTFNELARGFRIHKTTVAAVLERRGVSRRGKGPSDEVTALAIELYQEGHSTSTIASRFGFSAEKIRKHLLAAGITVRGPHDWRRGSRREFDEQS